MNKESRMRDIENLAEFVAESTFPNSRIEPEEIADQLGVTYNYGNYENAFDGLLEFSEGDFHIYINIDRVRSREHPRARFTFSHELGHYFIDEHRNALIGGAVPHASFSDYQSDNQVEIEADTFAAALLMPSNRFDAVAKKLSPSVNTIERLANQFGTSLTSTAIRYAKSNLHSVIAMGWATEERKWCWSSTEMYNFTKNAIFRPIKNIPVDSLTRSILNGETDKIDPKGSVLSAWCPRVRTGSKNDIVLIEDAKSLGNFGVLTLLYPDQ